MGDSNTHSEILLAGAFAAFTIDLLVYPLDTIKTRLQSRDYVHTFADAKASQASAASVASSSAAHSIRRAVPSPYALRGLYQGVGSVIIATLPASGVFFTTYETAKTAVGTGLPVLTGGPAPSAVVHSVASGIAELASCLVLTPAEVIKQNAQMIQANTSSAEKAKAKAAVPSTSSSLQALRMLLQADGGVVRRLLSGYTALAARNLPFTALQFPMFESMRARLRARWEGREGREGREGKESGSEETALASRLMMTGVVNGLAAGTSGAIAAVVTTPTDVVKTRMMLAASGRANNTTKNGVLRLARLIYQEHGVRGLFRGGLLRAGWTFVGSGLYLGTYEMAKVWLRGGRDDAASDEDEDEDEDEDD